jgi:hypothetical protein
MNSNLVGYSAMGNIGFTLWLELWSWFVFDVTLSQIRLATNLIRFDTNGSTIIINVIKGMQPYYWTAQIIGTITQATPLLYFGIHKYNNMNENNDDHELVTILTISAWLLCMGTHVITFQFIVARILSSLGHGAASRERAIGAATIATTPWTSCGVCVMTMRDAWNMKKMERANFQDVRYGQAIKRLILAYRSLGRSLFVAAFLIVALAVP